MKKIMFNDKYGLTQAVLEGRKTMTRCIIKAPRTMEGKDVYGFSVVTYRTGDVVEVMALDEDEAMLAISCRNTRSARSWPLRKHISILVTQHWLATSRAGIISYSSAPTSCHTKSASRTSKLCGCKTSATRTASERESKKTVKSIHSMTTRDIRLPGMHLQSLLIESPARAHGFIILLCSSMSLNL